MALINGRKEFIDRRSIEAHSSEAPHHPKSRAFLDLAHSLAGDAHHRGDLAERVASGECHIDCAGLRQIKRIEVLRLTAAAYMAADSIWPEMIAARDPGTWASGALLPRAEMVIPPRHRSHPGR